MLAYIGTYLIYTSAFLLCIVSPQYEHNALKSVVDLIDDGVCEFLPALVFVRVGRCLFNCEDGVQQQHTCNAADTLAL